jgi:hypothetical protein
MDDDMESLISDMKQIGIYETVMTVVKEYRLERKIKMLDDMKKDLQYRLDKLRNSH